MIFYKGIDLNSYVNGVANTKTIRTLGLGLKHDISGRPWCSSSANACNIDITTIHCSISGNTGSYAFTGDKNGSDNLEQIEAFEGIDDTTIPGNYPAFYFGKYYMDVIGSNVSRTDYESGWYLPSAAELYRIYACRHDASNGFDIKAAKEALGGDTFGEGSYWSSSQVGGSRYYWAYLINLYTGSFSPENKSNPYHHCVCCIREFN